MTTSTTTTTTPWMQLRGINTKSPLEDELEYQRALEEREAQQREMRETAAAIANAKNATAPSATTSGQAGDDDDTKHAAAKPKTTAPKPPRPKMPVFGAPMGTGVGGARWGGVAPSNFPSLSSLRFEAVHPRDAMYTPHTSTLGFHLTENPTMTRRETGVVR